MSLRWLLVVGLFVFFGFSAVYRPILYRNYALTRLAEACRIDEKTTYFARLSLAARSACEAFVHGNTKAFEPLVDQDPQEGEIFYAAAIAVLLVGAVATVMIGSGRSNDLLLFTAVVIALCCARYARWEMWEHYAAVSLSTIR